MESTSPVEESISAELVLVDPELARRARVALPDPPWLLPVLAERQAEADAPAVLSAEPPPRPVPRVARRPQRPVRSHIAATLAGGCALLVLMVALASAADFFSGSGELTFSTRSAPQAATRQPNRSSAAGATRHGTRSEPPAKRAERSEARSSVRAKAAPKAASPTKRVRPARKRSAPPRAIPASQRVFTWGPHAAAAYYELFLQRGPKTIYQARTMKLRATLPARLRLRPGTYKVLIRLAITTEAGIVPGPTIVTKTIRV